MATKNQEYEKDFYAWAIHNAKLLREGKLSEVDIENIAEEIESMGKRERRELINRFAILIAHLLKWEYQPARRSKSWEHEIEEQLAHSYKKALLISEKETGFELKTFPKSCPFSLKQILNQKFFPE